MIRKGHLVAPHALRKEERLYMLGVHFANKLVRKKPQDIEGSPLVGLDNDS